MSMEEPSKIEKWKRISILGSGAFGIVSLWKHTISEDYIAIKKCKFQTSNHLSDRQRRRWENEVEIMKALNCPNIVSFKLLPKELDNVLIKYNPTKLPLLSMEYCTKGNLKHVLNQVQNSSGLQESDVRVVLADIVNGVSYLHKYNITHRDIKPENIVLQECSNRPGDVIYKLIDLGYAKELKDTVVSFVGTLHYLAPEIMKTEKYDYSVDYWSLGVVTFEVICGVLPFLPLYTPVERFPFIEKKKPEHICIYHLQSGSVAYSSELLKENHISSCLKQNIENWLRHTLQFDPALRGTKFSDNTNVFDNLLKILDKKIISVFSVHTLEFYSYEVDEGTLISTLKEWIARDTKVLKDDQVILNNLEIFDVTDDKYVIDILPMDDLNIFVFKRGAFINKETFKLPKYVQVLFEKCSSKYKWRDLRVIYTKALFFLTEEEKMISSLKTSFKLCTHYIQHLNTKLQDYMRQIHKTVSNVLIRIDCYHNLHKNSSKYIKLNDDYKKHLLHFHHLLNDLEQCVHNVNELIKKVDILCKRQGILEKVLENVIPVVKGCDLKNDIQKAAELIVKGGSNVQESSPKDMVKVISSALKEKDKLLNNKNFQSYGKAMLVAIQDVEILQSWMSGFDTHVKDLSKAIDDNQREQYEKLLSNNFKSKSTISAPNSLQNHSQQWDTESIISENQELRCQIEDALGELMVAHRSFIDELKF